MHLVAEVFPQKIYDVFTSKNTISLLFPNYPGSEPVCTALLIFNFICYSGSFSMLGLFHLETTGNFQMEKQNKTCWSGLVWIKLIPGGVAQEASNEKMMRLSGLSQVKC